MVSARDLIKLREYAKARGGEITVFFHNCRYGIRIANTILAVEKGTGERVAWQRAFGTRRAVDLLNSMKVERVILSVEGEERVFRGLGELLAEIR